MALNVYSTIAFFLCLISIGQALSIPQIIDEVATIPSLLARSLARRQESSDTCPEVWGDISAELNSNMQGCNKNARTAIRFAFHDAGGYSSKTTPYGPASGGADGSLLLNQDEMDRVSQQPMQDYRAFLQGVYEKYKDQGVTAADLVQFGGAVGLKSCPGGPSIKAVVGREQDETAPPDGLLPAPLGANANYNAITGLFFDKGFSVIEIAALMGAHTVSKAFASQPQGIPSGGAQDTTPTQWDNKYYQQVQNPPPGVFPFESDVALSNPNTTVGDAMKVFAKDMGAWTSAFVPAMEKLSLLGIDPEKAAGFVDCTGFV